MNFIIRNLFLIFVLLCAVACSSDENFDQPSLGNIDFRVSLAGQSRVVIQKDGSGDFQVGDEVALRVYESQPDKLQDKTVDFFLILERLGRDSSFLCGLAFCYSD